MSTTTTFQPSGLEQGVDLGVNTFASTTPTADVATVVAVGRSGSSDKYRAIIDMDLTGARCGIEGVPFDAVVSSATLTLYCTSAASSAYACVIAPIEGNVVVVVGETTWVLQSTGVRWETAGGDYDNDFDVATTAPDATGFFSITGLAATVQNALDNRRGTIGLLLKKTDETAGTSTFEIGRCTQAYASTSRAPKLVVVWNRRDSASATPSDPPASSSTIAQLTGTAFFSPSRVGSSVAVGSAHPTDP